MFVWNNAKILAFILILILASGCSNNEESYTCCNPDSDEFIVSYGTSFGECIGYCKTSLTVSEEKVTYTKSGLNDTVKTIIVRKQITAEKWDSLMMLLQLDEISGLPEYIGCPDCADGGAEWIEIMTRDVNHKVMFEYNNEPEEVEEYVSFLRNIAEEINNTIE